MVMFVLLKVVIFEELSNFTSWFGNRENPIKSFVVALFFLAFLKFYLNDL